MSSRRRQYTLFDLVMWVIFYGLLFGFARSILSPTDTPFVVFPIGFAVWFGVRGAVRARRGGSPCPECGRRFIPAAREPKPAVCPWCRNRSLGPAQLRRVQINGWLVILGAAALFTGLIGLPFWGTLSNRFGRSAWIVVPLFILGAAVGLLTTFLAVLLIVSLVRNWLLLVEKPALAFARKCARQEGTIERTGLATIWWCGSTDPTSMVLEQMETSRRRFERLIAGPLEALPPVRILVFDERRAFLAYHRNLIAPMAQLDGAYTPRPARSITLTTEDIRSRLHDLETTIRALFGWYFLEAHKGSLPATWLQVGISSALAHDPDSDSRRHLNRRMRVALSRGTALGAGELFPLSLRELVRRVRHLADHDTFARLTQLRGQCWSLVEYLAGAEAPADRVGRFRSFLSDLQARGSQEEVFEHHFGHGFGGLLERWQAWVQQQGLGSDPLPPPVIRAALLERLIPLIRDRGEKAQDRVLAIREMGSAGYPLGADALIELLREGDDRFTADAAWALESISGLNFGNDPNRWGAWWGGLDPRSVAVEAPAENV
jgi:hypothetical protein